MPADGNVAFGSFAFDETNGIVVQEVGEPLAVNIRSAKSVAFDDEYVGGINRPAVEFVVALTVIGTDADDLRSKIDALKAAVVRPIRAEFYVDSDRFRLCHCTGVGGVGRGGSRGTYWSPLQLTFRGSPYLERAGALESVNLPVGATTSVTIVGNAEALPTYTFTVTADAAGPFTIENTFRDEEIRLYSLAGGTPFVVEVDTEDQEIRKGGVATPSLLGTFPAVFPKLSPTYPNPINVSLTGAGTITSPIVMTYRPRYL